MKREFLLNIFLLIVINFLVKPIYIFGVEARIQNLVGPSVYGVYFALFELVFLFQFINDPGIQTYSSRYISANRQLFNEFNRDLLGLKIMLAILFSISVFIGFFALGYDTELLYLLGLICAAMIVNSFFMLARTSLSGLGLYRYDSLFSALDKVFAILILGYFAWFSGYQQDFDIHLLPLGQLISGIAALAIVVLVLVYKQYKFKIRFRIPEFLTLLRNSLPYAAVILLMTAFYRIDGVMLERLLPDEAYQAGLYAAAFRFMDIVNMTGVLFGGLLLPMYSYKLSQRESVEDLFNLSLSLLVVVATLSFIVFVIYSKDIYQFLYRADYHESHSLLQLLMIGAFPMLISHSVGSLLLAGTKLKRLNILFLAALAINALGNYFAIPAYGAEGAALVSVITQWVVASGMFYLSVKESLIKMDKSLFFRIAIYLVLVCSSVYFLISITGNIILLSFVLTVMIVLILSVWTGIIRFTDIIILMRRKNDDKKEQYLSSLAFVEKILLMPKFLKWCWFSFYFLLFKTVKWVGIRMKTTRKLFFGRSMNISLPDAGDIFLFGAKSHPSEIKLARYMICNLNPGDQFVDVGAHQGFFTILAGDLVGADGAVHSFEPTPDNFVILTSNTKQSKHIHINNVAVSSQDGFSDFYLFPTGSSEYNSIEKDTTDKAKKISVKTINIDGYCKDHNVLVKMIKIDVEGHELSVLKGASHLLSQGSPIVILEYIPQQWSTYEQVHRLMLSYDYTCHVIHKDGRTLALEDPQKLINTDSENLVYIKSAPML